MSLLGFSPKLRLAPLLPALAAIATGTLLLWALLPKLFERYAAEHLLDTLTVLGPTVAERAAPEDATGTDLQGWVEEAASDGSLRLTVIAGDGTVLADSAQTRAQLAAMESHAGRPEVRQAFARGRGTDVRRSDTTGETYVYAATTFTGRGGRLFVLRLAQPLSHTHALSGRLAASMALAAAVAGGVALLLSLWLDRALFAPLDGLISGAGELAAGRSGHRLAVPGEERLAALAVALNRLAETSERQVAALRSERDHLQAILASMSEGVLVVGGDGRALLANPAFLRLFELVGEVTGRAVLELVRQPELDRVVREALATAEPRTGAIEIQAPERRTLALAGAALAGADGTAGAVVVVRETTEATRLAEMRRDFVANVSHELKTPLAAIRGFAETLRDGALDEPATARRFTDRILEQCRRLQALLEDLLTLSRLESVEMPAERAPVDLRSLVRRAVDLVAPAAEEKRVRLAVEEQPMPAISGFEGDADDLERLVLNLLENAIKYNRPHGTVTVRLRQGLGQVVLEVEDTGIGIPQEALSRIFERFYRVDKSRAREEGGTGLGLAIVKHVAQAHGGQVEVESRPGRGTTFRVRLPLAAGE